MVSLLPELWPITNITNIILLENSKIKPFNADSKAIKSDKSTKKGRSTLNDELFRIFQGITYLFVAYVCYIFTFPVKSTIIEASTSNLFIKWCFIIILRDIFIVLIAYSSWHYILFHSSYSIKMKKLKFNSEYPTIDKWKHDAYFTLIGTLISSIYEICILQLWKYKPYLWQNNLFYGGYSFIFLFMIHHWRSIHFYFIHRLEHPWFKNMKYKNYDIGRYLYKNIHYLHHESTNPGPFSGLSMHPLEHIIYFSCIIFPLCFNISVHPLYILTVKWNCLLSPIPGHDGFDKPSGGGYYHYLHHAHFECNYGSPAMDKLFGTFEDGTKYKQKHL
eukprot:520158_1